MSGQYLLVGHDVVPCDDVMEWARRLGDSDARRVALDLVGDVTVSTVFLGIDHSFRNGPPILFETMVFGGPLDEAMERYSTWDAAEAGHALMVEAVRRAEK